MSAIRYSGQLRITVTLLPNDTYRASIRHIDGKSTRATIIVCPPACLTRGLDDPREFDDVASAALSFANDDGWSVAEHAATTDTGWHIGRSRKNAFPKESV